MSVNVSVHENKAKTIQYIIHFTCNSIANVESLKLVDLEVMMKDLRIL